VVDDRGVLHAQCGMSYYLFGHPNPAVAQRCHAAYSGHASVAYVALIVVLAATTTIAFASWPILTRLVSTPSRAALAALTGAATLIALPALQTTPVQLRDSTGPFTAHCGIGF